MKKTVDFIVLNWRSYKKTLECINSIKDQSGGFKTRVIVVDNETDPSKKSYFAALADKVVYHKENTGFAAGVNSALPFLKSEFTVLLNNDAILHKNWLIETTRLLTNPEVGMVGGVEITPNGATLGIPVVNPKTGFVVQSKELKKISKAPYLTASNVILPTSLIKKVGGLDSDYFAYYEDIDLCAKVLSENKRIIFNPLAKVEHEVNYSSNRFPFKKQYLIAKNRYRFMAKVTPSAKLTGFILRNVFEDIILAAIGVIPQYFKRNKSRLDRDRYYRRLARVKAGYWAIGSISRLFEISKAAKNSGQYSPLVYSVLGAYYHKGRI